MLHYTATLEFSTEQLLLGTLFLFFRKEYRSLFVEYIQQNSMCAMDNAL